MRNVDSRSMSQRKRTRSLGCASAAAILLASSPAFAGEWYRGDASPRPGGPEAAARSFLTEQVDALRLGGVHLEPWRVLPLGQLTTVRFVQSHAGLPVVGTSAVLRIGPDGGVRRVVLDVARDLRVAATPTVGADAARTLVAHHAQRAPGRQVKLAVLPDPRRGGRLVWTIDVPAPGGGHRYFVDAHGGEIAALEPLGRDVLGRVYPINPVKTSTPADLELLDLDPSNPQRLNGWGGQFSVANYVSGVGGDLELSQEVGPNVGADFLYDPPADPLDPTDAFAQVGVYYHLTRMRDFFSGMGVDMSAPDWKLVAITNAQLDGAPIDNAYFAANELTGTFTAPNQIVMGQGSQFDFSIDSDVFLHEFTHYVTHNAVGFNVPGYKGDYGSTSFGGSLDEGLSDYFSCTVNDDAIVGDATLVPLGYKRDLTETGKVCPDDLGSIDLHDDGELIGSLAWTLRAELGRPIADQLVWGATSLLTVTSTFGDFGEALGQTADDLAAEGVLTDTDAAQVRALAGERGLDDCGNVLTLDLGPEAKPRVTRLAELGLFAEQFGIPCESIVESLQLQSLFHFEATPPEGASGLRFQVDLDAVDSDEGPLRWNIYVRRGDPVGFESFVADGAPTEYDYAVEAITAATADLVVDGASNPPFDPAAKYFLVLTSSNCPAMRAAVSATLSDDAGTGAGGGGAGGESGAGGDGGSEARSDPSSRDDESGCACRTATPEGRTSGASSALLALALGAMLRRLRRARGR